MKKGLLSSIFILGFLLSGYIGYYARDLGSTEATAQSEKPAGKAETNKEELHNDVKVLKDITYWIDGVPRKAADTIIRDGEVYVPANYIASSMGIPFDYQPDENVLTIGQSMSERVHQEKFLVKDGSQYISIWMTLDQVGDVLGQQLSSKKNFNECTGSDEVTAVYRDAEILFIYDVTDKQYHVSDITVLTENIASEKGIVLGSSPEEVIQFYGDLIDYTGYEDMKAADGLSGNGLIQYGLKESLWFELKDSKVVRFGVKLPHC